MTVPLGGLPMGYRPPTAPNIIGHAFLEAAKKGQHSSTIKTQFLFNCINGHTQINKFLPLLEGSPCAAITPASDSMVVVLSLR